MTWTDPATWYANLASFYAAAAAFITDPAGNVLLVKPTYRDHWAFPGGYVDEGENPHEACAREIREELGIPAIVRELLVVDWAPPAAHRPRSIVSFTFDCGQMPDLAELKLAGQEIEDAAFLPGQDAQQRLPDNVAPRVLAAMRARARSSTVYLPAEYPLKGRPTKLPGYNGPK
ncbi:NUDIX hydrolase [Micromonospora sp. NPDC005298]|uniref:NUDIX hydrolase n=1 Tax=Micromonospora sp. NPDC005298 TaxID=3156873 RepID=UPI0033BD2C1C